MLFLLLFVVGNEIGDDGVKDIARALCHTPHLTHLALDVNRIRFDGAHAIASVLEHTPHLTYLDLSMNRIDVPGLLLLAPVLNKLKHLTHLHIAGNDFAVARCDRCGVSLYVCGAINGPWHHKVSTEYDLCDLHFSELRNEEKTEYIRVVSNENVASDGLYALSL
eukprot:c6100_g1_i1.p1 GENE.c6100_g1_i1~~c6100_g1_i1.p1  ORF type:complete len:165 (-),score=30.78 c6100_g1_i1:128-622(-)